jgi:C-terminal processing protease CtpA/Prc
MVGCPVRLIRNRRFRRAVPGIFVADVIAMIDGKPVRDEGLADARRMLREKPAGSRIEFMVRRGTETHSVTLILQDQI